MPRQPRSLAVRLLLAYLATLALTVTLVCAGFAVLLYWVPFALTRPMLGAHAHHLLESLRLDAAGRPIGVDVPRGVRWLYQAMRQDVKFRVVDTQGHTIVASDPNAHMLTPVDTPFDPDRRWFDMPMDDQVFHVLTTEVPPQEAGPPGYYLQVASSERALELGHMIMIRPLLGSAAWTLIGSVLMLIVVLMFTLRRMLRPLRTASAAAERIEPSNLGARLSLESMPTELQPLINAFNLALERLERGYRVQQELLGAAAHELKTPLTLIRGQIELSTIDDREVLLKDIDFMARQVHQLLHLAEASEPLNYAFEPLQAGEVAGDVLGQLGRLAEGRRVLLDLQWTPSDQGAVKADRGALFVLIRNLVENAILHSPPDTRVTVTVSPATLSVRDQGLGIAAEHLPKLFTRFWRGPGRHDPGAGLGLAICAEIARAHGWQLGAQPAAPGAEFVVNFEGLMPA